MMNLKQRFAIGLALAWSLAGTITYSQTGPQTPVFASPEITSDRRIIFRIFAPDAKAVTLRAGDIPMPDHKPPAFTRNEQGIWETTAGPVPAGAYRYTFVVDGVTVMDPRNPAVSESNATSWSLAVVPGADFVDVGNVPHGSVATIYYYSTALGRTRRMHIYTPPGYESGSARYPVFYLLHGASDSDDSWTSVGRANFIVDNLIATRKAVPMIIVMPAGHTTRDMTRPPSSGQPVRDEFSEDFVNDIMPYVEKNYRILTDRPHTAIAGLSMGGGQTLNISMLHLDRFAYVGVFSSGVFSRGPRHPAADGSATPPPTVPTEWIEQHSVDLDNADLKAGLKLLWFSTGSDDALIPISKVTVAMLKEHGFKPVFLESAGGHTWLNWRDYLNEFAPQLFQ
jgi:enterochelin esterase family protein